ncbi:MAG: MBL fold metallo-hydrolase [Candidatus Paceibacterota bacterium]|jgi:L-ascorbate metabolism protein UlaG (beta-lactamase superfamily)
MKITKFGHSCLLVEEEGVRLLFDPGNYSTIPENLANIDAIIITHEHQDHYTPEILKKILDTNKDAQVITNSGVGAQLDKAGIAYQIIEDGQGIKIGTVEIEGTGTQHALIYPTLPRTANTGYLVAGKFFHPGDSFETIPARQVEILALPVIAPWCRVAEAVDFAKAIKPKYAFAIHDANLKWPGMAHGLSQQILPKEGIDFRILEDGKEYEF